MQNTVVKSQILVKNSMSSQATQNLQVTNHEERFPKFMFHRKQNQLLVHLKNTLYNPLFCFIVHLSFHMPLVLQEKK